MSKAVRKSINKVPTISPLSMLAIHFPNNLTSAVIQLCLCLKPDWHGCINLCLFKIKHEVTIYMFSNSFEMVGKIEIMR